MHNITHLLSQLHPTVESECPNTIGLPRYDQQVSLGQEHLDQGFLENF